MSIRHSILNILNRGLATVGFQLIRFRNERPWDEYFQQWIARGEEVGADPNDVGDRDWADDPLAKALATHYLPFLRPESVVLELGPGSGRLTRHLIGRCREIVLLDYSDYVCAWLSRYLAGKGNHTIHRLEGPTLPMVGSDAIDLIVANGVFEHIDLEDLSWLLGEFFRVARPGAIVSFNFDNLMSPGGSEWFKKYRGRPGERSIFRFYHPGVVRRLAEEVGFECVALETSDSRFAHIDLRKGPQPEGMTVRADA